MKSVKPKEGKCFGVYFANTQRLLLLTKYEQNEQKHKYYGIVSRKKAFESTLTLDCTAWVRFYTLNIQHEFLLFFRCLIFHFLPIFI